MIYIHLLHYVIHKRSPGRQSSGKIFPHTIIQLMVLEQSHSRTFNLLIYALHF